MVVNFSNFEQINYFKETSVEWLASIKGDLLLLFDV